MDLSAMDVLKKPAVCADTGQSLLWAWSSREIWCDLHNKKDAERSCVLQPLCKEALWVCRITVSVKGTRCYSRFKLDFRWEGKAADEASETWRLRAQLCLVNVVGFHPGWQLWFLALDQCQQVCSDWLLMTVHVCPIFYCFIGAFHLELLNLFVLWWCCLLCFWHQCGWNPLLEGCVLVRSKEWMHHID